MMTYETAKALFSGAGLTLSESHFAQFQCYLTELVEVNRHMNLTAITATRRGLGKALSGQRNSAAKGDTAPGRILY